MCGIVGIINFDGEPVSPVLLKQMTDVIAHRGPDGEGHWLHENIGFGHRRLAILDLSSAGHQPMISKDSRYVLTYNGEIYNFRELRCELEAIGYQFHSDTDSEVVLNAYAAWGARCVERFNGMFAFGIYDRHKRELFLARDRYGIKPLYYAIFNNKLIFASEQKAIIQHPEFKREVDKAALLEYFTFQNMFTDKNLLGGVNTFPAGNFMNVDLTQRQRNTGSIKNGLRQYWDYNFSEPENPKDEREYVEELDRLFRQAVKRQLVSDVDIGAYLSGGMDSGAITAIAAQELPYMRSFTCGFDLRSASGLELAFDEREKAEYMSYLFKTEHYEMVLKAGDMERCMPKLAWHLESPRVGQSYPNYYAAQLASKFNKVVLAGTGGDELFAGYPWRYYRAVVNDDFEHYIDKYYKFWQRLIPNATVHKVFSPIWDDVKDVWTRDIFRDVFKHHAEKLTRAEDYVNHSLYFESKTFLQGLLTVEDKLSMAHGLESRVPFLDNDLVDFAMKVPVNMKLGNLSEVVKIDENEPGGKSKRYFEKTHDGKLILRKALSNYIPDDFTQGVKQGFSAPDASWFKGDSIEYVKQKLFNNNAAIYDYMDIKETQKLVNEHLSGEKNRRLLVWSLLNFDEWSRQFI